MNSNQIYANEHKMRRRRIIVCLDGTWETPEEKTNVYKFFNRIDTTQTDEWEHSAQYYSGLGTHWRHPLMGGLFGYGISKQIVTAYQYICNAYRDEKDEIWLLGFSRGAFAARSLSGMINNVGLLPSSKVSNKAKRAFQIYRDGSTNSYPTKKIATKFRKDNQCIVPTIQFLGCFDTVGALGIPKLPWYLGGSLFNRMSFRLYGFHDLRLPPNVINAFHAIAIHDQRAWFRPTLMSFSDDDNTDSSSSIVEKTRKHQYLEQVWFPGMHTDVGGGQDDDDDSPKCGNIISYQALQWMVDKAVSVGLRFKDINIEKKTDTNIKFNEAAEKCYSFKYNDSYESKFIYRLMPRQDRIIEPDALTKEYRLDQLYNNGNFSIFLDHQQLNMFKSKTLDNFYENLHKQAK